MQSLEWHSVRQPLTVSCRTHTYKRANSDRSLSVRNVYTLIDFGDFVEGATTQKADPYIQLLSTADDPAEAHSDFLRVRGDSPWTPTGETILEWIRSHLPLVIGVSGAQFKKYRTEEEAVQALIDFRDSAGLPPIDIPVIMSSRDLKSAVSAATTSSSAPAQPAGGARGK